MDAMAHGSHPRRLRETCIGAEEKEKLRNRLRRIEGQVRGIERMVAADCPCVEILVQLGAVRAATEKVALLILKSHAGHSVRQPADDGVGAEEKVDELVSAVERFLRV